MSQAAGKDLVPFFQKLQFKVRKIAKEDILNYIKRINAETDRSHH